MLGLSILGYPSPTLLAWGEDSEGEYQMDQGAHILTKLLKLSEYLEQISEPGGPDDLVLLADGYDVWFQLRPDVLITRYHAINKAANERLRKRLGSRAIKAGDIDQRVLFGASKICSNQPHTIACYAAPEPYTPNDLYGGNTDIAIGRSPHDSFRPRYLSSGYILGPAKDLREILRRALFKMANTPEFDRDNDNGSGGSDFLYHGDDASVYARVFGEQEYQREALRRKYGGTKSWGGWIFGSNVDRSRRSSHAGTPIDDVLNPPFTHERMPDWIPDDRIYEFGIGIDYGGDIGAQTAYSERDHGYIVHSTSHSEALGEPPTRIEHQHERQPPRREDAKSVMEQVEESWPMRNDFDCKVHVNNNSLPRDVSRSQLPYAAAPQIIVTPDGGQSPQDAPSNTTWSQVRLYTNLCLGSVPVMIHHNGARELRTIDWEKVWWQKYGSPLLEEAKTARREPKLWMRGWPGEQQDNYLREERGIGVGAWSDKGWWVQWEQMCPREFEQELFRGLD